MSYTNAYAPSAPELPESFGQQFDGENKYSYAYPYGLSDQNTQKFNLFSPETHPEIVRSFESADRDRNGYLDEWQLRHALSLSGYEEISNRTIKFLMFIYKCPGDSLLLRLGPKEYVELWNCLVQWRAIFERYDRDRNGKMNSTELRDAFYHLGYMLPTSVLQLIISQFDDGTGETVDLCFDRFLECGMIVKGLTDKFKEKDHGYTGYATLSYDAFMLMIIPFIASYD